MFTIIWDLCLMPFLIIRQGYQSLVYHQLMREEWWYKDQFFFSIAGIKHKLSSKWATTLWLHHSHLFFFLPAVLHFVQNLRFCSSTLHNFTLNFSEISPYVGNNYFFINFKCNILFLLSLGNNHWNLLKHKKQSDVIKNILLCAFWLKYDVNIKIC